MRRIFLFSWPTEWISATKKEAVLSYVSFTGTAKRRERIFVVLTSREKNRQRRTYVVVLYKTIARGRMSSHSLVFNRSFFTSIMASRRTTSLKHSLSSRFFPLFFVVQGSIARNSTRFSISKEGVERERKSTAVFSGESSLPLPLMRFYIVRIIKLYYHGNP